MKAILVDQYGFTVLMLGVMSSVFRIVWGLSQAPMGVIIDRYERRNFLILARRGYFLVTLGYLASKTYTMFLGMQVINGIAHSLDIPAFNAMVFSRTPEEKRATVLGKISMLPQMISFPAPIIGGYLYELFGFNLLLILILILLLTAIMIVVYVIKPRKGEQIPEPIE
jgi:MFS family permease